MAGGFCPQCGSERQGAMRFCAKCGFDYWKAAGAERQAGASSVQPPTTSSAAGPPSSSSGMPGLPVILGAVLIVALVVVTLVFVVKPGASAGGPSATAPPTAPPPQHGTGVITFGGTLDETTLEVTGPASTFTMTAEVAWSASLSDAAGATSVELVISRVTEGGAESVVTDTNVSVADPSFDVLANKGAVLGDLVGSPGTYTMRYFRGSTKLSEGTFTLVK